MTTNRRSAGRHILAILILSVLSLTACAKKPPVVLQGSSKIVELKAGQPAPEDGYLLSPEALVDLMECCGAK